MAACTHRLDAARRPGCRSSPATRSCCRAPPDAKLSDPRSGPRARSRHTGERQMRAKASEFPRGVMELFDGYVHGRLSRREFLDRAAVFAVGGMTAGAMFEALRPDRKSTRLNSSHVEIS